MSANAQDWLTSFRELHQRAKLGCLSVDEKQSYAAQAEMFCKAILGAQAMPLLPGASARRAFRIGVILPVELRLGMRQIKGATLDLSSGGFSMLGEHAGAIGEAASFTMTLSAATEIVGQAKVAGCCVYERGSRTSFAFVELDAAGQARIDSCLIDLALARVAG
jgi:hypothetical protein